MIPIFGDYSAETCSAWLASAGLPAKAVRDILECFETPVGAITAFLGDSDRFRKMIPERYRQILYRNAQPKVLDKTQRTMQAYRIGAFSCMEDIFPEKLHNIQDPPAILFYRGNTSCLENRMIAVVGSRNASYQGLRAAKAITKELSRAGVTIISGLAIGIDQASHEGCITGGSQTVAVLGCGLDIIYPQSNSKLSHEILQQGGLLLSEYAPGEKPLGYHFPVRNRIISGLSDAVILMEAKVRSGSMTTVRHALDQGKDVFVYPGEAGSVYFEGNHILLREGARFFTNATDILQDMNWLDNHTNVGQNIDCSGHGNADFSEDEKRILLVLKPGKLTLDQIAEKTGMDVSGLLGTLTMLQVKGSVVALPGKNYQLKN